MIGSTNARPSSYPRDWELEDSSYIAGEDLQKNTPIAVPHRFSEMNAFTLLNNSERFNNTATAVSPDSSMFINSTNTTPYMNIFVRNSEGTYDKKTTGIPVLSSTMRGAVFTPAGDLLLVCVSSTPYLYAFKVEGTTLTSIELSSIGIPALNSTISVLKFSDDGTILVLGNSPSSVYKLSGDKYVRIGTNITLSDSSGPSAIAITPNNRYLIMGYRVLSYVRFYRINDDNTLTTISVSNISASEMVALVATNSTILAIMTNSTIVCKYDDSTISYARSVSTSATGAVKTADNKYAVYSNSSGFSIYKIDDYTNNLAVVSPNTMTVTVTSVPILTSQNEMVLVINNNQPLAYRLNMKAYKLTNTSKVANMIECIGYTKESKNSGSLIKVVELSDFDRVSRV